jgi:beta-lactamase regulating signal transducer with metallopeptidase domain
MNRLGDQIMWWWRKVRRAEISDKLRTDFERYGETMIALALANPAIADYSGSFFAQIKNEHKAALDWLTERRDIHERREDRLETVEIAILIFVVLGVIVESGLGKIILNALMRPSS